MKTALLFLCLFCYLLARAQDSTAKRPTFLHAVATYDFAKTYGISVGASLPFHSVITHEGLRRKDEFISLELAADRRPLTYSSLGVTVGAGLRFIRSGKHFTDLSFEQGVLRTFYDGQVYQEQLDGSIKELPLFGRTYATTAFSYAQNWSISNHSSNTWFIQVRPCVWIQYPYNSFVKPHLSVQVGLSYHFRDVTAHARTKYKYQS